MERTRWYKDAVVYQIYPRSFFDGNGDGIGDLRGIISKLDYLQDLGVTCVWLSPCYKSPNDDNGYDISDYRDIMTEFGTLEDWDEMVEGMHKRGIKLVMDLVANHTSDEHPWFQEAKKSKDSPYHDYYIWRDGHGGKKRPNNWTSRFGGSAWEYNKETDEFYLHLFTKKQPDLNWDNPSVRKEIADIVEFWLKRGCDGFRCDVITYISKTEGLPNGKFNPFQCGDEFFTHGPHIHEYLHELNVNVLSKFDCMTVGEGPGVGVREGIAYTDEENEELDTVFSFEHVNVDMRFDVFPKKLKLPKLKEVFHKYQKGLYGKGWNSLFFENHDQPRSLPRFTGDYGDKRKEAAKMLAVALYMMQGTPYVYQGQEIGMTNFPFTSLDQFEDVLVKYVLNAIHSIKIIPFAKTLAFKVFKKRARDHARTPMQWDASENAGFTTGKPWYLINPNYTEINAEESRNDENGIFNFYKKLIAYRKGNPIIINGTFDEYYRQSNDIFCYRRDYNGKTILTVANFKNKEVHFELPADLKEREAKLVLSNYEGDYPIGDMKLKEYQALVWEID